MSSKFTILGSGSSMGVPRIDGYFGKCNPKNKKNYRTRCSAIIKFNNINILIDTSPDLRNQLIKNKIKTIDKVFYTHLHADQTHGINDLRAFFVAKKKQIPTYADRFTSRYLFSTFKYCFKGTPEYPSTLKLLKLKKKHIFSSCNKRITIKSIPVEHGKIKSICYLINSKVAYASDVSLIYKKDLILFKNIDFFVVDCLWYKEHPSHFNLDKVLKVVEFVKPKKTILTNLHNDLDYNKLLKILPNNIIPGYDGLTFEF